MQMNSEMPFHGGAGPLALTDSSATKSRCGSWKHKRRFFNSIFRTFLSFLPIPIFPCKWLALPSGDSCDHHRTPSLGHFVTGTLYGYRKGHVYFAVQEDPRSHPVILLELATPTSALVKEMSSGLVRIALECDRNNNSSSGNNPTNCNSKGSNSSIKLLQEPLWSMFCNGRKSGYAVRRICTQSDSHILGLVQTVSMGAGVLPMDEEITEGELMYMRAKFERVVGSRDSEALYMMNPDGTGAPELSIFFLRI